MSENPIAYVAYRKRPSVWRMSWPPTDSQVGADGPDVLASWKDADPGVPLIEQARAEYAKLQ